MADHNKHLPDEGRAPGVHKGISRRREKPPLKKKLRHRYVLITPAHNEEKYIEGCIRSVISQTIPPAQWIIVSDRSTDRTDKIVEKYAAEFAFLKLIKLPPGGGRDFASKVSAFKKGYAAVSVKEYGFIGNLDADVSFEPDYYERVLGKFETVKDLGISGGTILELVGKRYRKQMSSLNSIAGAVQLFRRECFEEIGGFVPIRYGGEDSAAEIAARMNGWEIKAFDELEIYHHRRVSGSSGLIRARFKSGIMHYQIGYRPAFQVASAAYRLAERPFIIGSIMTLLGYLWASARRLEKPMSGRFLKYMAEDQQMKLRALLRLRLP